MESTTSNQQRATSNSHYMIIIQEILVSEAIIEQQFICNLQACKGACCVEGDYGAPLEEEELFILGEIYEKVKPFLTEKGIVEIEKNGVFRLYEDTNEFGTPLLEGDGPCVYVTYDKNGIAWCGIEQAYRAGLTDFQKPISCHLYPIRVVKNKQAGFEALNYDEWEICSPACALGQKEKVPVYLFLKEPLIRQYGEAFFEALEAAAKAIVKD